MGQARRRESGNGGIGPARVGNRITAPQQVMSVVLLVHSILIILNLPLSKYFTQSTCIATATSIVVSRNNNLYVITGRSSVTVESCSFQDGGKLYFGKKSI